MTRGTLDTDVLIVGAGPVGLFLAHECLRRGLRWRLIETHSGQSAHSKALAIFPRTLEILDMAGLSAPFLEAANRVDSVAVFSHGRRLAEMPFAPPDSPYPFIAMIPQDVTERLLAGRLLEAGGTIEYESTLVSATEEEGRVRADIEQRGKRVTLHASFVVGCDGAHSKIRHLLNLPFEGKQYDGAFLLADVETNDALPPGQLQLCPHESGPLAIFPMNAVRRRIVAVIADTEGGAPSIDLVRRLLAERAPAGLLAHAMRWSSYFRVHHRHVARLRVGRFLLAGDAAHIHSPFGGQGMNTGLHDVWNLAWKLDLVVRGLAGEPLLDTYTAERLPVIEEVIRTTDLMTKAMGTPNRLAQTLRDVFIPALSRLPPFQHAFVRRLSGLGISYARSPIVEGSGNRYFDDSLRGGTGIGNRFLLLGRSDADAATSDAVRQFSESFKDLVESRVAQTDGLLLVRPDGYIAYAPGTHAPARLSSMRSLLQRQSITTP